MLWRLFISVESHWYLSFLLCLSSLTPPRCVLARSPHPIAFWLVHALGQNRIYSIKRRGVYYIFYDSRAAFIRGQRLFNIQLILANNSMVRVLKEH